MRALNPLLVPLLIGLVGPSSNAADDKPPLSGVRRVVFLGDSITHAGQYVEYLEAYLRAKDPALRCEFLDLGLPSETVSGLSEPGHAGGQFPRPALGERLDRVLEKTRPDLVVACYGMNDGIYYPYSDERFQKYREGMRMLRDKAKAAGAKVLHITPPVFDPLPIRSRTLPAGLPEYRQPYVGYDEVLNLYAAWLLAERGNGWDVVDAHGPMDRFIARERLRDPNFRLAGDGVHIDAAGHWLIAREILLHWGIPPGDLAEGKTAEEVLSGRPHGLDLLKLVRRKQSLLKDAWLSETGHKRPGMKQGLPLKEAEQKAGELEAEILKLSAKSSWPDRVSDNHRYLLDRDGKPFFYLGDTAWELFHRLDRDEADLYLRDRSSKGFTVIQAVVLAEYGGLEEPNAYGHLPLTDKDPARPIEAYFEHVDYIVNRAEQLGLTIGMLPTWGDKWNKKWGQGPEIFTPENAATFGEFLGRRYRDKPIVWILGGDRPIESDKHREIIRAMASGLRKGDEGRHLMTFHPTGGRSSSEWFQGDDWLAFNMLQSGHSRNRPNYDRIAADYAKTPIKPCLDGEPGYEDHPADFDAKNGYLDETDARKAAYWALFAGALGHTYGCHDIWQFLGPKRKPVTAARTPWQQALTLPGAGQMRHVRSLIESRPFLTRMPDQSLLVTDPGRGADHVQATRGEDGSYAFAYSASGRPFKVDLDRLSGDRIKAAWFDPRRGTTEPIGSFLRRGTRVEFHPPTQGPGCDWVLILDDEARKFPDPGGSAPSRGE